MPRTIDGWLLAGTLAGIVIAFVARVAVFLASCALANAAEPKLVKAVVLGIVALAVCVPISWWMLAYLEEQLPTPSNTLFGPAHAVWLAVTAVIIWALPAIVYKFLLPTAWRKGVLISGLEVVLGGLLAALVAGVILVILAGVQVARRPAQADVRPAAKIQVPST